MLSLTDVILSGAGTALVDSNGATWYIVANLTKHVVIRNEFTVRRLQKIDFPFSNLSLKEN